MIPEIWLAVGLLTGFAVGFCLCLALGTYETLSVDRTELDELREIYRDDCRASRASYLAGVSRDDEADTEPIQAPRWRQYPAGFGCGECD